ncbi:DNA-binding MarR family transcriptional regulator [Kibdelosporangium banguiense]|uniref:DNA-binding MarR family transcriptional regulator n=1 Tax=Kibdelosporangium banguiense TaxID=1365924 RepID=A0ABS4T776_9PSEU|nr:MarR family transcriptional regulator [Kibdelosporangium banguiense]MBP2320253.1 DNA-binding MarR family transcriptional regulator [Kibdelosporangium banguiense]
MTNADVDLVLYLSQASHALTLELTAGLAELGITPRHQCVLSKALPGDLTQNRLAELAALDKTTMVVTVDELERAGYAERRPSKTDRRARVISVTDAGKSVLARSRAIVSRVYGEVLSGLQQPQREAFVDALVTLVEGRLANPVALEKPVRRPRVPKL